MASSASPVRARTMQPVGRRRERDVALEARQTGTRTPSASARTATPRGEYPFSGSSQAGVTIASPEAIGRSQRSFWSSLPACSQHAATEHGARRSAGSARGHARAPRRAPRPQ